MKPWPLIMLLCMLLPIVPFADEITLVKHARRKDPLPTESASYVVKPNDTLANIFIKNFGAKPESCRTSIRNSASSTPGLRT